MITESPKNFYYNGENLTFWSESNHPTRKVKRIISGCLECNATLPSSSKKWAKSPRQLRSESVQITLAKIFQCENERLAKQLSLFYQWGGKGSDVIEYFKEKKLPSSIREQVNFLDSLRVAIKTTNITASNTWNGGRFVSKTSLIDPRCKRLKKFFLSYSRQVSDKKLLTYNAIKEKKSELLIELFKSDDYPIDLPLKDGYRALYYACTTRQISLAEFLADSGADVNFSPIDSGLTPLHISSIFSLPEAIELLLDRGADPQACDCSGNSPLHYAVSSRNFLCVQLLLSAGTDIHATNCEGNSAAHLVVYSKDEKLSIDIDLLHLLIQWGADLRGRNGDGQPPLQPVVELADRSQLKRLFASDTMCDILAKADSGKRVEQFKAAVVEQSLYREAMELSFIIGDISLAKISLHHLSPSDYEEEVEKIKNTYAGSDRNRIDLTLFEEAKFSVEKSHLLKFAELYDQKQLERNEYRSRREDRFLYLYNSYLALFDAINFASKEKLGYRSPSTIVDSDGVAYSPSELRNKLILLLKESNNHIPKIGTPALSAENSIKDLICYKKLLIKLKKMFPQEFYHQSKKVSVEILREHFHKIDLYLDIYMAANDISDSLSLMKSVAKKIVGKIEKKAPREKWLSIADKLNAFLRFLDSIEKLYNWYHHLNLLLEEIYILMEKERFLTSEEKKSEDPTPYAGWLIDLALAGDHCGTRVLQEAQRIYAMMARPDIQLSLNEQLLLLFRNQYYAIVGNIIFALSKSAADVYNNHNVHLWNSILQTLEVDAGIRKSERKYRQHFADPIATKIANKEVIPQLFYHHYTPTLLIDTLDESVNGRFKKPPLTQTVDYDLLIDWFVENIPETWEAEKWRAMNEAISGLHFTEAKEELKTHYGITLKEPPPLRKQLLEIFLKKKVSKWNLQLYKEITTTASALKRNPERLDKMLVEKYELQIDENLPIEESIDALFEEKMEEGEKKKYREILSFADRFKDPYRQLEEVARSYTLPLKLPAPLEQIEEMRKYNYLFSIIDPSGKIKRSALIYFLKKIAILY